MTELRYESSAGAMPTRLDHSDAPLRAVREAQASAAEGDLVLVRLDAPIVAAEALLSRFAGSDAIFWQPPAGAPSFVGIGVAYAIDAERERRFEDVRRRGSELLTQLYDASGARGELDTPRLFGGFAFSPDGARKRPWSGFGPARFVLPRVQYALTSNRAVLTLAIERDELARGAASEHVQLFRNVYAALLEPVLPSSSGTPRALESEEPSNHAFRERVADLVARIAKGELLKAVTAREVRLSFDQNLDAAATLVALRCHAPDCLRFSFRWRGTSFLGATPELLVRKAGRALETEALAGSIDADSERPEHQLRADPKELEEHALVVSAIARALGPWCDVVEQPSLPEVRSLKHILHLCTPIRARLRAKAHVLDLVESLHPTPAVGGVPTRAALDWIERHESFDRGWYSGAIGWFDAHGDGHFGVALRSGLVRQNQAWLYAGAGIVRESVPAAEDAETTLKLTALLASLRARE